MSGRMNAERFVAIDLETTGLNPQVHNVLEVACVVTDADFEPLEIETWLFHFNYNPAIHGGISQKVVQMHTDNGLWDECRAAERGKTSEERIALWREIEHFIVHAGGQDAPLLGSNPGFDRLWLEHKAPNVASLVHYRSLDVNSLYLLEGSADNKPCGHRALDDVLADLEVCKRWRGLLQLLPESLRGHPPICKHTTCAYFGKPGCPGGHTICEAR